MGKQTLTHVIFIACQSRLTIGNLPAWGNFWFPVMGFVTDPDTRERPGSLRSQPGRRFTVAPLCKETLYCCGMRQGGARKGWLYSCTAKTSVPTHRSTPTAPTGAVKLPSSLSERRAGSASTLSNWPWTEVTTGCENFQTWLCICFLHSTKPPTTPSRFTALCETPSWEAGWLLAQCWLTAASFANVSVLRGRGAQLFQIHWTQLGTVCTETDKSVLWCFPQCQCH